MKIAVQLYSLRDIIKGSGENLLAILPRVKALGYDGVEFAGYFGVDAATLRAALDSAGLVAVGTHIAIESYSPENFDKTAEFCRTLGMKTMGMGGADHETPEELKATCAELKAADERAAKIGMSVYYHNHCSEFEPISDGVIPFDELKKAAHLEIDTYWSFVAGQDNLQAHHREPRQDSSAPCQGRNRPHSQGSRRGQLRYPRGRSRGERYRHRVADS